MLAFEINSELSGKRDYYSEAGINAFIMRALVVLSHGHPVKILWSMAVPSSIPWSFRPQSCGLSVPNLVVVPSSIPQSFHLQSRGCSVFASRSFHLCFRTRDLSVFDRKAALDITQWCVCACVLRSSVRVCMFRGEQRNDAPPWLPFWDPWGSWLAH